MLGRARDQKCRTLQALLTGLSHAHEALVFVRRIRVSAGRKAGFANPGPDEPDRPFV